MTGFSFTDPPLDDQEPAELSPAGEVTLDAFWPAVNIGAIRRAIRLDPSVTSDRLREATRNAVLHIADQLEPWRLAREAEGFTALDAVPPRRRIDGESDYAVLWARAVCSEVGADLAERQLVAGATAAGVDRAEQLKCDVDVHRRNATFAVRDFLGRTRVIAEAL